MKNKHVKQASMSTIVFLLFTYLTGSFASADFNIANWTTDIRELVAFAGGSLSIIVFVFSLMFLETNE